MLSSFKQKTPATKVVQLYISKLNSEMIDILRKLKSPSTEVASRYRKISGCHTKGYACLMGEKGNTAHFTSILASLNSDPSCETFLSYMKDGYFILRNYTIWQVALVEKDI